LDPRAANGTGRNGVHGDVVTTALFSQCLSQPDHSPLRSAIRTAEGISLQPRDRGYINDAAGRSLEHVRQGVLGAKKRAGQVDRNRVLPFFEANPGDKRGRAGYACIVDQNVDLPKLGDCRRNHSLDARSVSAVGEHGTRLPAKVMHFLLDSLYLLLGWTSDAHPRSPAREPQRYSSPYSCPPAGHDRDFTLKLHSSSFERVG